MDCSRDTPRATQVQWQSSVPSAGGHFRSTIRIHISAFARAIAREELMKGRTTSLLAGMAVAASSALAAEVTPQRLLNPEPHNWLMNHRTYDGQRFSPLARITKDNVKNLKLAYAVPLGGGTGNEWLEATPLVEDGFLYITDAWGVLYKIDGRSGDVGRVVWRMEPKQERMG